MKARMSTSGGRYRWRTTPPILFAVFLLTAVSAPSVADSGVGLVNSDFRDAVGTASTPWNSIGIAQTPELEATEVIYVQQCAPCHGTDGEGGVGPALTKSAMTLAERDTIITDGRGAMPAFGPTLTVEQVQSISAFLTGFVGRDVYETQCAPCHGVDGEGGVGPPVLTLSLLPEEINSIVVEGRGQMPAWGDILTDDQIQGATGYLSRLALAAPAGAVVYAEHCAPCHGTNREGGVGPALTDMSVDVAEQMAIVANGSGQMPAFGTILTDDQLTALSAFLEEPGDQAPADRTGESIYMDHCRVCHGDNGVGGSGPSLLTAGLGSEEIAVVVADGQGSMPAFSDQLSAGERETVAEFVTTFTPAVTTSSTAPVDVSGEGIYVTACSACHGPTGEGGAGPALQGATLTQPDLVAVITAGRGSMPAFSSLLSAEEIDAVAGFATTLTPTSTVSTAPSVISGGEIFAGTCARCHGSAGAGGEGPTLAGTALSANEIVVVVWSGHPGMPAFHETLTADEIVAVSVYAASLQALEPADGQDDSEIRSIPIALGVAVVLIAILGFAMIRRKLTARRN